jgi:ABC-type nitrate/sulfonate/bicarbonate transport system permease component
VRRGVTIFTGTNALGWAVVVLLVLLAELAVRRFDLSNSVSAPSDTLRALVDGLTSGELSRDIATTLNRWAQGFAIAIVLGVTVGVLVGASRTLDAALSPLIELLRPIPAVAFIPLAILAFGFGTPMIRSVVAFAAVWPILVSTLYGVRGSDRMLEDVARMSGVGRPGRLARVTVPAALPGITAGIRVAAPIALVVCVTAEYLARMEGIGAYMQDKQSAYELPEMYAAVVLTALLGYGINAMLRAAERRAVFWVGEERVT